MISDGGLLTILYIVQSDLKAITIPGYYCIELHLLPNELFILFYTCHILYACKKPSKQARRKNLCPLSCKRFQSFISSEVTQQSVKQRDLHFQSGFKQLTWSSWSCHRPTRFNGCKTFVTVFQDLTCLFLCLGSKVCLKLKEVLNLIQKVKMYTI